MMKEAPTACILIIGNEILSGKTQDKNVQFLGRELARLGIRLMECRIVRDDVETIAAVLNDCRSRHTYVFTTGGIGPTHDDITTESVALAFGTRLERNKDAVERLVSGGRELTEARLKMAMIPPGATLIDNALSQAPGFRLENVFVLAGIPSVAQSMFHALETELIPGATIHSGSVDVYARESDFADALETIALANPGVEIGSYPFSRDGKYGASLVVRGVDEKLIATVLDEIERAIGKL